MRKVLSFVLVLALVLSSFSMAFAADSSSAGLTDINGTANEDAIQVAYDLGIVTGNPDGTFLPEKAVNRAEFAAMITRALAIPDSALAGYSTSKFKDTTGYSWAVPYLAFCNSKGIMLGDGAGNAMPGRTINPNEAITMALRAVGYTNNSSELVGVWPSNYVTKAQELGLYNDVAKDSTGVDKANAAQVIYNVLTVQKVAVNSDGSTDYLWDNNAKTKPTTLLTAGLDCEAFEDVIMGINYDYDACAINIVSALGAHGTAYVQKSGDKKVVAFIAEDSTALTGSLDGDKFKAGDVKYSMPSGWDVAVTTVGAVISNGYSVSDDTVSSLEGDADGGEVTLNVDLSGKTIKEVWSAVTWSANIADQVTANDLTAIEDNELLGSDFPEDNNGDIDLAGFELVGVNSLSDIKADHVVYIYEENQNGDIRKIAVGTETVTGTIDEIDGGDVTVNGKVYSFYEDTTEPAGAASDADMPSAGDDVTLTLDAYGNVYAYEATGSAGSYAIIKENDTDLGDIRVRLYTSEDATKTYLLADESDITLEKSGTTTSTGMTKNSVTSGALIGYGLDKGGDIDALNLTVVSTASLSLDNAKVLRNESTSITKPISDDVVIFTLDGDGYDMTSIDKVNLKTELAPTVGDKAAQYILDKDEKYVVAMLISGDEASRSSDDVYGVINTLTSKSDNGDTVQRVVGFGNGAALDKLTTGKSTVSDSIASVAAFTFELDSDGKITKADLGATPTVGAIVEVNADGTSVLIGTEWYSLADDAAVYEATTKSSDTKVDAYKISKPSALRKSTASTTYMVYLYDFNTDKDHEGAEVAVFVKY